jgi:hypothetical protein
MKLWMSGEIQADVADAYREARKIVEVEVNRVLGEISVEEAKEWAFIAIILDEESSTYGEIVKKKKSSRGTELEFRLKIPHAKFLAASPGERISLIYKALSRSVSLMEQLGVSSDTQNALRAVLFRAEK